MTETKPDPHELPKRARIGYVLKYCNVKQGELKPPFVFWIMERKGLIDYEDAETAIDLIGEVMKHSSEVSYDG